MYIELLSIVLDWPNKQPPDAHLSPSCSGTGEKVRRV